jgi:hypothetical protein
LTYSNEQRTEFLELAAEVGITKAKRTLGFPNSWTTGKKWVDAAGIEVPIDSIMAQARAHGEWYSTKELMLVCQTGLQRAQEALENNDDLSADEQKKLAEAVQKYTNTIRLLEEKATSISERRETLPDIDLMGLFADEEQRNTQIEEGVKSY